MVSLVHFENAIVDSFVFLQQFQLPADTAADLCHYRISGFLFFIAKAQIDLSDER